MYVQIKSDTKEDCWLRIDRIPTFGEYAGMAVYLPSGEEKYRTVKSDEIISHIRYEWNEILDRYGV